MYLLDTNVLSERTKPQPNEQVTAWLGKRTVGQTSLSVITLAELEQGIVLKGDTKRAAELHAFLRRVEEEFTGRILAVDRAVTRTWASMTAGAIQAGKTMGYADSLIAATALTHGLTVVTRNVADFQAVTTDLVNPWED